MQLNYCFKKEWAQFTRTYRLLVILIAFVAISVSNPALFGFTNAILQGLNAEELPGTEQTASISLSASDFQDAPNGGTDDIFGELGFEDVMDVYSDAGLMFSLTASTVVSTGSLVIMIALIPMAGGEQKKRAMIVPMCSGLSFKNYLIPKFVIYPLAIFTVTFLSVFGAGMLCEAIFPNNHPVIVNVVLTAFLAAIYVVFLTTVHMSLGLCTSRPGVMAVVVYGGSSIIESLLQGFGLVRFHPFALTTLIANICISSDFSIADEASNILISVIISLVVCVVMFFLALAVLSAKKINNREEIKPEF